MTAPISNEPTTTRLHHYAGRYSSMEAVPKPADPVRSTYARQNPGTMEQERCHGERKLALQESHSPTCGTKLALLAQNGPIWRVLRVQGELSTAAASNKPSRANFLPHQPQHHHGLDRNDAPARHKRPKITHFPHAGANFLTQHTPPTQHAPTPGRFFFQPPKASPSEPTVACNSHQAHPDTTS